METSKEHGKGQVIELKQIKVGRDRGRKDFKGIESLMESIGKFGLAHPLVVVPDPKEPDKYVLVAGERRYRACCLLGWSEVPCTIRKDLSSTEQKELELEENIKRKDLVWSEEIELVRQIDELKKEIHGRKMSGGGQEEGEGWGLKDTAKLVGKSVGGVSEQIQFAKLLEKRPDLKEQVETMPLTSAMKVVKQKLQNERLDRLVESKQVKLVEEFKQGNARKLIRELKDNSIDLLLTDPPYGMESLNEDRGLNTQTFTKELKEADNLDLAKVTSLFKDLAPEFYRVLRPGSHFYIFFAFEGFQALRESLLNAGFEISWMPLIWSKGRSTHAFRGYEFMSCYEPILYGYKPPRTRRLREAENNILECKIIPSQKKTHPFEKPRGLLWTLLAASINRGETVLDPFAGTASTLMAAMDLQMSFVGFELDKDHFKTGTRRLLSRKNSPCAATIDSEK